MCSRRRVLVAGEQGTGKTILAAAAACELKKHNLATRVLTICPGGLTWQFAEKLREFTDENVKLIEPKARSKRTYVSNAFFTVTSYGLFLNDFDQIASIDWDILICDEAEEFSNNKSKTAKKLKELNVLIDPTYRWPMTGTAIANKLEELYSIFYFTDKVFLPPWPVFEKTHVVRNQFGAIYKYKNLKPLHKHLKKRLLRITHEDLKGQMPKLLPPKIIHLKKDKEVYDTEANLLTQLDRVADSEITIGGPIRDAELSKAFHAARQALVSDRAKSTKLSAVQQFTKSVLKENDTNRVINFCFYKDPLKALLFDYEIEGTPAQLYTGEQSNAQRKAATERFREFSSVLLCSDAGARGLDLPFVNHIVHLDVPFSHATNDQRNKRSTRANSIHRTAVVTYLIFRYSIEEYFYQVTLNKGKLAEAAYSGTKDKVTIKTESLRQYLQDVTAIDERKSKAVRTSQDSTEDD